MIENALPFTGRDGARHIRGVNDGDKSTNPVSYTHLRAHET